MFFCALLTVVAAQTPLIQDDAMFRHDSNSGPAITTDPRTENGPLDYRLAAKLLEQGWPASPEVLFRTGNAWFLAGDLPRAIAAYRRGLADDPADSRLRTALDYARNSVRYQPADHLRPERMAWPPWLTLRSFAVSAFASYCLGCAALTRWLMVRRRLWLVSAAVSFALAAIPAVGSGVQWWHARRDAVEPIVVVSRDTPLRAGNGADYPPKVELPRGCEVRRLFVRGGWLQVETGSRLIGWVPAAAVVD